MEFNATKTNEANAVVSATISGDIIKANVDKLAKQAAKTMDIQGFRKGKVPVAVVKNRYAEKLTQDAQGEALRELLNESLAQLEIADSDVIGEPGITKFDKKEDGSIEVEVQIACKPSFDLGDYKALLPEVETKEASEEEVEEKIKEMAANTAPMQKLARKRMVRDGDYAVIDFEGFKDGVAFEGGKAEKYTLQIGSGSFIPGFEDQVIGMKYEEEKEINVTFPEGYQAKDLAGAEVVFKVKLHEIQEKGEAEINDELAQKLLHKEDATVETLKEQVADQIKNEKMGQYYNDELKPAYLEKLVDAIDFAVPTSVLEQEIAQVINGQVRTMSEDEIKELQNNAEKIEQMRKEATPEATKSVKATFIIDALAKAESIEVSDQELTQTLYYEAMMTGQDGQALIKQYEEAGYMPAIKMSMIEHKVITKLLDEKAA